VNSYSRVLKQRSYYSRNTFHKMKVGYQIVVLVALIQGVLASPTSPTTGTACSANTWQLFIYFNRVKRLAYQAVYACAFLHKYNHSVLATKQYKHTIQYNTHNTMKAIKCNAIYNTMSKVK